MTGILFDLDGTLLDTLEDLTGAVNAALGQFGYPACTREQVRQYVGNGAEMLIRRAVPRGIEDWAAVLAVFREYYAAHCREATRPYPGIPQALEDLKQHYPLGVVSNKPDLAVKKLCRDFFPGLYARGEGPDCRRKPWPEMLFQAMAALGADRCLYVGDSEVDLLTARNAGMPCLSVLWGFRDRETLEAAGGTRFCEHPSQLIRQIEEMEREYGQ